MVKIPGLDDLKKMGSGLIDQAKAVKFGEMVDKVKSGIESVSAKKPPADFSDAAVKGLFQGLFATMTEFAATQAVQVNAMKKLEKQLEELARVIEASQKPVTVSPVAPETTVVVHSSAPDAEPTNTNKDEGKTHE